MKQPLLIAIACYISCQSSALSSSNSDDGCGISKEIRGDDKKSQHDCTTIQKGGTIFTQLVDNSHMWKPIQTTNKQGVTTTKYIKSQPKGKLLWMAGNKLSQYVAGIETVRQREIEAHCNEVYSGMSNWFWMTRYMDKVETNYKKMLSVLSEYSNVMLSPFLCQDCYCPVLVNMHRVERAGDF